MFFMGESVKVSGSWSCWELHLVLLVFAEPTESNMNLLDQLTLTDTWDQEALEDFLDEDGEDAAGPVESGQSPPPPPAHRGSTQLWSPSSTC